MMISAAIDEADKPGAKLLKTARWLGERRSAAQLWISSGVAFLERGRRAADAVGRVAFLSDAPQGTGFLVGPGLFLTNHHVIE